MGKNFSENDPLHQHQNVNYQQQQQIIGADASPTTLDTMKTTSTLMHQPSHISQDISVPMLSKTARNFSNERDKSMQDMRENGNLVGSLRTSRQKKTIRKTGSPSTGGGGGVCFSLFKCCDNPKSDRDAESRI